MGACWVDLFKASIGLSVSRCGCLKCLPPYVDVGSFNWGSKCLPLYVVAWLLDWDLKCLPLFMDVR